MSLAEAEDPDVDPMTGLVFQNYIDLLPKIYDTNAMSRDMKKVCYDGMGGDI